MANVTLAHVARQAQVSISTASRALNASPRISSGTAERVRKAAAELGYHPNLQARALSEQRTGNIGLLIANPVGSTVQSDEFFLAVLDGASRVIERSGLTLVVSTTDGVYAGSASLPAMVVQHRVDAVIAGGIPMDDAFVRALNRCGLPVVFIGRYLSREYLNTVTPDNVETGRVALEYLLSLGHRKIVVFSGPLEINTFQDRFHGAELAAREAVQPVQVRPLYSRTFDEPGGYDMMRRLLADDGRLPTAVLGLTDWLALGALRALREQGLRVPEDVSVMGLSDIAPAAVSVPPLTTVRVSPMNLGMLAARLVLSLRDGEVEGPVKEVLPPWLIVRSSCAPARQQ